MHRVAKLFRAGHFTLLEYKGMSAVSRGFSLPLSRVLLSLGLLAGFYPAAYADSIRVDTEWYVDVYIGESAQFYHVLNPKDGTTLEVSKKRKDISAPRLSKDPEERARLKAAWQKAAEARKQAESRDVEVRVQTRALSRPIVGTSAPRSVSSPMSAEEQAAQEAEWQRLLEERRAVMEDRERYLAERAGMAPPEPEGEQMPAPPEAPLADNSTPGALPTPPGPRAQPAQSAQPDPTAQAPGEEMQRMEAEPYFQNDQERYYYEQNQAQQRERMQAEAYLWQEQMNSEGYLGGEGGPVNTPDPSASPTSPPAPTGFEGEN